MGPLGMKHESASNLGPDAVALSKPIKPCSHCAEAAKRSADLNIPSLFQSCSSASVSR